MLALFSSSLVKQEVSTSRYIDIPDEVFEAYLRVGRPTPLYRAKRLEDYLKTPARIYYKRKTFRLQDRTSLTRLLPRRTTTRLMAARAS